MKGSFYLLVSGILIFTGAFAGFIINMISTFHHPFLRIPGMIICLFLMITGILGIVNRNRSSFICSIFGISMSIISVISIPLMFWIDDGSAPAGMLLAVICFFVLLGLYMKGVNLNKRSDKEKIYRYAASLR